MLFIATLNLSAQVDLIHPCYDGAENCTANDFELVGAKLASDALGTPLTSSACDNAPVDTYLCVDIENTTGSNRHGAYFQADIVSGPDTVNVEYCFDQLLTPGVPLTLCIPAPSTFSWTCNSGVSIDQYLIAWSNSSGELCPSNIIDCSKTTKSKCRSTGENITVDIPVISRFSFECAPSPARTIKFIDLSFGGSESYTSYLWSFGNGMTSSNINPLHTFEAAVVHSVTLQITDSDGNIDTEIINVDPTVCFDLPVVWTKPVSVVQNRDKAQINFSVSTQVNNSHFDIEKSTDGRNFTKIGHLKGEGNSTTIMDYSFEDNSLSTGPNFYRIKQVDFDGKFSYSNIASLDYRAKEIIVYPNPVDDYVNIYSPLQEEVFILNQLGQIVYKQNIKIGKNELDLSNLSKGLYQVKLGFYNKILFIR